MKRCLVRAPSTSLLDGIVTYGQRVPVDVERALVQWRQYVGALEDHGFDAIQLPSREDCPDATFVEDILVLFDEVAVVTRPSMPARLPEIEGIGDVVSHLGFQTQFISSPGCLEGGDVLRVGNCLYVGVGGRSNVEGCRQLEAAVVGLGATICPVPIGPVLHLKSAVTALPDGRFIGYPPLLTDPSCFPNLIEVPEKPGANVVVLGENEVLMPGGFPQTHENLVKLGLDVSVVDVSEFQKLEGDVTCLSVLLD
jgi:dimethylargininase